MKISIESASGSNLFTAYGDGYVDVNGTRHGENVVVTAESVTPACAPRVAVCSPR